MHFCLSHVQFQVVKTPRQGQTKVYLTESFWFLTKKQAPFYRVIKVSLMQIYKLDSRTEETIINAIPPRFQNIPSDLLMIKKMIINNFLLQRLPMRNRKGKILTLDQRGSKLKAAHGGVLFCGSKLELILLWVDWRRHSCVFLFTSKVVLNNVKGFLINFHVFMWLKELYFVQAWNRETWLKFSVRFLLFLINRWKFKHFLHNNNN